MARDPLSVTHLALRFTHHPFRLPDRFNRRDGPYPLPGAD